MSCACVFNIIAASRCLQWVADICRSENTKVCAVVGNTVVCKDSCMEYV